MALMLVVLEMELLILLKIFSFLVPLLMLMLKKRFH